MPLGVAELSACGIQKVANWILTSFLRSFWQIRSFRATSGKIRHGVSAHRTLNETQRAIIRPKVAWLAQGPGSLLIMTLLAIVPVHLSALRKSWTTERMNPGKGFHA